VKSYLGGGVLYQGISTKRSQDAIGLALAHNVFSETYRSSFTDGIQNETAFEFSYRLVTNTRWFLQPNVQYVINPGTNSNIPNALMGMVRFNYSW
jgi:porin